MMEAMALMPAVLAAVEIGVVDGIDGVLSLVAATAPPRHRFLDTGWFRAATRGASACTISARDHRGEPRIAIPLVRGRWGIRAVPGPYWPFRSFPVAETLHDGEMAQLLAAPVARAALGPVWRLGPILDDDPALAALRHVAHDAGWAVIERRIATTHILDMRALAADGGWPRGSTLRKNRYHEKHLAEHGALAWRFVSGADWTSAILDDLAAIEARSWHAGSADAKFLNPEQREHWQALIADPAGAARMHAAILDVGGTPAAFSFDVEAGDTRYAIANSYDPTFARHSPGKCLYYRSLALALATGIARVDWGAGDSGYKATIGAEPAAELVDCLILRRAIPRPFRALLAWGWRRSVSK